MRPSLFFWLLLIGLLPLPLRAAAPQSLQVIMTVDWEGDDLRPENLKAMAALRQEFPKIPLLHYLNAAYFTKPSAKAAAIRASFASVIKPGDQFGVHIHGWKSLFEAAGVVHRTKPSWERGGKPGSVKDCSYDCGREIPISAYTVDELRKVLRTSKRILSEQGFTELKHFRAGGWVTSPALLEALAAEGFKTDSSAVPVPLLADELVGMELLGLLRAYWPGITTKSQPYLVTTAQGRLWQVPDNAGLADYVKVPQAVQLVQEALKDPRSRYVVAGFHQETADDWQDRVRGFLRAVEKLDVRFVTMPEVF